MYQLKELTSKCWQILCSKRRESNTQTEPKTEVTLLMEKLTESSSEELVAEMDLTSPSSISVYSAPAKRLKRSPPGPSHEELLAQHFSNTNEEQAQTYPRQSKILTTTLEHESRPQGSLQKELFSKPRKMPYFTLAEAPPTKTLLLDLQLELLDYIVSYLPLPSKACLALCSKGLYRLYSTVLRDDQLRFPRMPLIGWRYILTDAYHHRMTLLMQLENRRWACCGRCQKLHPCREFYSREIDAYGPYERSCAPCAGIVDLCPCISLTIRDRNHIIEYLIGSKKRELQLVSNGLLKDSQNNRNEHTLLHKCDAYLTARVDIELSITESNQLVSCARYDAFFDVIAPWMISLLVCPHTCLASCLQYTRDRCALCDTYSEKFLSNSDIITVCVSRYLGRDKWFGDLKWAVNSHSTCFAYQWYRQSRNRSDYTPRDILFRYQEIRFVFYVVVWLQLALVYMAVCTLSGILPRRAGLRED